MKKKNKKLITALCGALATGFVITVPVSAVEAGQFYFDVNGGTWVTENGERKYAEDMWVDSSVKPFAWNQLRMTRKNYYLSGYTTQKNGTGDFYYIGEKVSLTPTDSSVTKFPSDITRVYAKWKQYKTTKTVNLRNYKFTSFTNSAVKGAGYSAEGGEVYKVGNTKYFIGSWIDNKGTVKLAKFNYETDKSTGVSASATMYHSNGMAYGDGNIYIAPGEGGQNNYVFKINESGLKNISKVKFENNKGVVDDWFTSQAVAYYNGKLFVEGPGGRMIIYNPKTNKIEKQFFAEGLFGSERYDNVQGMAVNGNEIYVLACNSSNRVGDQKIFVYDYTAAKGEWKKEEWNITGTNDEIEDISFVDGKMYLIRGGHETCGVYDLSSSPAKKNGWYKENGKYKYYVDGKYYTGWHEFGKGTGRDTKEARHWTYFDSNGYLLTGWQKFGKGTGRNTNEATHWSYFGSNGWLVTGWQEFGKGTGRDTKETRHWTYFDANGWLLTGWQKFGKGTGRNTNEATHWSYFGGNGWLRTGWQQMGKGTSNPDGNAAKHWSYFGGNGWMRTGLQNFPKTSSEAAHKSYFGTNGWLRVNTTFTTGNVKYRADARGWLTKI